MKKSTLTDNGDASNASSAQLPSFLLLPPKCFSMLSLSSSSSACWDPCFLSSGDEGSFLYEAARGGGGRDRDISSGSPTEHRSRDDSNANSIPKSKNNLISAPTVEMYCKKFSTPGCKGDFNYGAMPAAIGRWRTEDSQVRLAVSTLLYFALLCFDCLPLILIDFDCFASLLECVLPH